MKIEKHIITRVEQDISIKEITLLSVEKYERCKEYIKPINGWWWLRSPGHIPHYAACIDDYGSVDTCGNFVSVDVEVVRPVVVLRLSESKTPNLQIGDNFEMAGFSWTMIADDMALCDTGVGQTAFRKDWQADDANVYEASDVKKWLERWAKERMIVNG